MAHTSEKRWPDVSRVVSEQSVQTIEALARNRELHQQLFEAWDFAGGTAAGLAALLFKEEVEQRNPAEPTAAEIQMAQDLADAVVALNDLWECANSVAKGAEDRAKKLRRLT